MPIVRATTGQSRSEPAPAAHRAGSTRTYEQLAALTAYADRTVPIAFEDNNGQLNVRHYLGIGSEGLDESLESLGIPHSWPAKAGLARLGAEHHLTYLHELRTSDRMSVRVRLLGRTDEAVHAVVYVLDDTNERSPP